MSSGADHDRFSESLSAYALGALPADEEELVREHLAGCPECRAEVEWLSVAVDVLPASVPQIEPRPELKASVMRVVESEASLMRAAGGAADRPPPHAARRRPGWPGLRGLRPALALACAAVVAAIAVLLAGGGAGTRTIHAQVAPVARGASATLRVTGTRAELVVNRLPAPALDHVLELWVQRGSSAPVPAGTFIVRSGSVVVGQAVRPGDHVLVTVEPGRGTTAPTTTPFITANV